MQPSQKYLDPQTLASLQGLELRAHRIVEGYVAGLHKSPFQGYSVEFAEHREYVPGDDLRYVDWKVYGRTDKIYLKRFEEETNLLVYLVLDISRSMHYQSDAASLSKLEYAKCICAALGRLVLMQQDSVGLATFDEALRQYLRPSGTAQHFKQMLHLLDQTEAIDKTNTGPIFHDLAERFTKRGLVVIVSDLFDDVEPMLAGLKHLRHRKHDVIVFHLFDPAEWEFPFRDATLFRGLEAEPELMADPRAVRQAYLKEIQAFQAEVQRGCRLHQVEYVRLQTDQSLGQSISRFLAARAKRVHV
ncbi:VWFA domain-containing protein [Planctomycetales bacterium 10988]|nr:VWFA domain-containing protein [Planctomycetales bacterium 10988]